MHALPGFLMALAAASSPQSQEAAARPPAAVELDRVVVTARRRPERLNTVPAAITVETGESLEARGARDITALADVTPNLVAYPGRAFNGALTVFIRGIGQGDPVWGVEPGVGVYIDDVFIARPQGALLDILDVERVEVLRGPQGTLYGRNTLGGAIKYVTRKPQAQTEASVTATVGTYARRDVKAMLNLPLGQSVKARLSFGKFDRGGYGHNLVTGAQVARRDAMAVRLAVAWQPRDDVQVEFAADRYQDQSGPQAFRRLAVNFNDPAARPPDPGTHDVRSGAPDVGDLDAGGGSLTATWDLAQGHQLRAISAYRRGHSAGFIDFDSLPVNLSTLERAFQERQLSHELQYLWSGGKTQGVAGVFWMDGSAGGIGINTGLFPFVGVTRGAVGTRTLALYANATWPFREGWELELGARATRERKTGTIYNASYAAQDFQVPPLRINSDFSRARTYRDVSPRISVSRTLGAAAMAYVQASRGYKAGTFNVRANQRQFPASALPLEDESVTSLEAGLKGHWLDGRLDVRTALFQNHYDAIQLSVFTPYDSNGDGVDDNVFGDFRNAGSGTLRGAEVEAGLAIGQHLRWRGQAGYLDTGYDHYYSGGQDLAHSRRFANAPRWTAGSGLVLDCPLAHGGWLVARIDGRFQSKVYQTPELDELLAQPGYAIWNAGVEWISAQQRWRVAVRGENLGDAAYRVTGFSFPAIGIRTAVYGAPRTWALSVTWSY